ncbi:MAG: hypothetical protein IIW27_00750, partial [Clostridia bacterium]|nr:hypothetical protein [Clostridia bacterium]
MSELHEKPIENEEELSDLVELVDETGRVLKFYHLATMDYKDECFAFFQAAEEIEGVEEDEVVIFEIKDDGCGFDATILDSSDYKGVGIKNTYNRIVYEYGSECGVDFAGKTGEGTLVTIRVLCLEDM